MKEKREEEKVGEKEKRKKYFGCAEVFQWSLESWR